MSSSKLQALWNHPAGPKTIHFWAPSFKWGLTVANIADLKKPSQEISYPLQAALVISGGIWMRYSTIVTPKNWNLFSVSAGMAATGALQFARKLKDDMFSENEVMAVKQV